MSVSEAPMRIESRRRKKEKQRRNLDSLILLPWRACVSWSLGADCASKAAMDGLLHGLVCDLSQHNIQVCVRESPTGREQCFFFNLRGGPERHIEKYEHRIFRRMLS